MLSLDEVKKKVLAQIPGAEVQVLDMTGEGDHLEITVISEEFQGKPLIKRHRMVYAALGQSVGGEIHAAKLVTRTPGEVKN